MKVDSIRQMYRSRGFKDHEIENQIKIAEEAENIDSLFSESTEFFSEKYSQWVQQEAERAETMKRQAEENAHRIDNLIKSSIGNREIYGERISDAEAKELEKAIYDYNTVIDYAGQKIRVSEIQKFLLEWENSPELRLYLFKKYKFRDSEAESIKKEVKKEIEKDFLKGYETVVRKDTKATVAKQTKQKLEEVREKNPNKTYFVDLSKQ